MRDLKVAEAFTFSELDVFIDSMEMTDKQKCQLLSDFGFYNYPTKDLDSSLVAEVLLEAGNDMERIIEYILDRIVMNDFHEFVTKISYGFLYVAFYRKD